MAFRLQIGKSGIILVGKELPVRKNMAAQIKEKSKVNLILITLFGKGKEGKRACLNDHPSKYERLNLLG